MPPRRNRSAPTLGRKIYFYKADIGTDDSGLLLPFDPKPTLSIVNQLPFTEVGGRYLASNDDGAVCGWIDDHQGEKPRMRFGQIRRAGLPQIEQSGNLTDLDIAANAGLVEAIHVVFFPLNIVGVDFNFYGPRLSRLGNYLFAKCGEQAPCVTFHPLLRKDVVSELDHLTDIRLFDLKIRASFADTIRQADEDLGAAFNAARNVGNAEEIEVVIRPARAGRLTMMERLIGVARALTGHGDLRSESSKFAIKGKRDDSERVELIDLLHDQLISKKQIVRMSERSRALDMSSAYDAIITAYEELGEELRAAPRISP